MSATALQLIALALGLSSAVCWGAVATATATVRHPLWWGLAAGAVIATIGTQVAVVALWSRDWWFAADRVVTSAPLSLAALVWFGISAARDLRAGGQASTSDPHRRRAGAFAAAASVFVPFVLGAPLTVWTTAAVVVGVVGATAIAAISLTKRRARRPLTTVAAAAAAVVVTALTLSLVAAAAPGPLEAGHGHEDGAAQGIIGSSPVTSVTALRDDSTVPAVRPQG